MRRVAVLVAVLTLSTACDSSEPEVDICEEVFNCITGKGTLSRGDLQSALDECIDANPGNAMEACAGEAEAVAVASDDKSSDEVSCISPWATPQDGTDEPEQAAAYKGFQAAIGCNTIAFFGDDMPLYFSDESIGLWSQYCDAGC